MKRIFFVLAMGIAVTGCFYDKEEELYGAGCNTTNVSFATTINTMLQQNGCIGCHGGTAPSGNVNLQGHANVKANANRMFGAISHAAGFQPMPLGSAKLSECDIKKVKAWIDAGTPDN